MYIKPALCWNKLYILCLVSFNNIREAFGNPLFLLSCQGIVTSSPLTEKINIEAFLLPWAV